MFRMRGMRWSDVLTSIKRNFKFYSILGFTTTLMASWESILL